MGYIQNFGKYVKTKEEEKQISSNPKGITETVEPPEEQFKALLGAQYTQIQALTTKIQQAETQLAMDKKNLQTLETSYVKALSDARAKAQPAQQTTPTA
jgi:hypothetical protein